MQHKCWFELRKSEKKIYTNFQSKNEGRALDLINTVNCFVADDNTSIGRAAAYTIVTTQNVTEALFFVSSRAVGPEPKFQTQAPHPGSEAIQTRVEVFSHQGTHPCQQRQFQNVSYDDDDGGDDCCYDVGLQLMMNGDAQAQSSLML